MARDPHLEEVELLTRIFQEAFEAHRGFKARWTRGAGRLGGKAYRETAEYQESLSRFHARHRQLEEAIRPALESVRSGNPEGIDRVLASCPFGSARTVAAIPARFWRALSSTFPSRTVTFGCSAGSSWIG